MYFCQDQAETSANLSAWYQVFSGTQKILIKNNDTLKYKEQK